MARFTIKTRTNGTLDFFCPDNGGYIRLDGRGANHGSMGRQICAGGGFGGSTLTATPATLEAVARRWYTAFRADQRKYDYPSL